MKIVVWLVTSIVAVTPFAGEGRAADAEPPKLSHCVVSLIEHAQLPAQLPGVLVELGVKEGDIVRAGQILGRVDDTEAQVRLKSAQAKLDVAKEKAENDAEVRAAHKVKEMWKAEYDESKAINEHSPNTIAPTQLRKQRVQWEKATEDALVEEMKFRVAKLEEKAAAVEIEAVQTDLQRRVIRAPFDGVVVQLQKQRGEWVQPGDAVMKLIGMKRLRVEGFVSADKYAPEQILGADATIKVNVAGEGPRLLKPSTTITFVSPTVEASGEYRISAEIDNPEGGVTANGQAYPWLVRPGSEVEMTITLKKTTPTPRR